MSAAPVLFEQPKTETTLRQVASATTATEVPKKRHEAAVIVAIAIVIAFTFTVCVIGTILILLALRGSGVVAVLSIGLLQVG